jgi:D-glycero-D-manno-heptose 1,7-bisphosphate phosphatase
MNSSPPVTRTTKQAEIGDGLRRPALFFDRDGVLMEEVGYCADPAKVRTPTGLAEFLRRARKADYLRVIITNQSGIGRGFFGEKEFESVQQELLRQLEGEIDGVYYAPGWPEEPPLRRKPSPTMLLEAALDLKIDLCRSWMIGDRNSDIEAGRAAGTSTILVKTGYGAEQQCGTKPNVICSDVLEAIAFVLSPACCETRREGESGNSFR